MDGTYSCVVHVMRMWIISTFAFHNPYLTNDRVSWEFVKGNALSNTSSVCVTACDDTAFVATCLSQRHITKMSQKKLFSDETVAFTNT